ncbi:smg-9, nonsense mediated mRNA decay factor [Actinomortierella wolfii]|nr:smg-9, nonsense mediated mRNA decay factor [Actinomortierella wolfii]
MQSGRERHARTSGDGVGGDGGNGSSSGQGHRNTSNSGGSGNSNSRDKDRNDRGTNWRQGSGAQRRRGGDSGSAAAGAGGGGGAPIKLLTRSNSALSASTSSGHLSVAQNNSSSGQPTVIDEGGQPRDRNQGTARANAAMMQQHGSSTDLASSSSGGQGGQGRGSGAGQQHQQQQPQRRHDDDEEGGSAGGGGGKEKPRRERRDRSRRHRSRAHGREIEEALNDPVQILLAPSQHPQPQQQQRVIVDPNSFQRQVFPLPSVALQPTSSTSLSSRGGDSSGIVGGSMGHGDHHGGGGPHSSGGGVGDRRSGSRLFPNPNSMNYGSSCGGNSSGGGISNGRYTEYDSIDPFAVPPPSSSSSSSLYGKTGGGMSKRPPPPPGRTVYSWQNSSSAGQSPHFPTTPQHQQQQQLYQFHSRDGGVSSGGGARANSAGGGLQDLRPMSGAGIGGHAHSTGGGGMMRSNAGASTSTAGAVATAPGQSTVQTIVIPPAMTGSSVKFINETGKIMDSVEQWLSDHPGHFVVGVLGGQGVGKSTLLSTFAGKSNAFHKQTRLMAASATHQTVGMDMYVTSERVILLDTEPLYSMSSVEAAVKNDRIPEGMPIDIWMDRQALIMATFLFSVCNVVIIMAEECIDTETYRLLRRVDLFLKALSQQQQQPHAGIHHGSSVAGQSIHGSQVSTQGVFGIGDWCADIILVTNKLSVTEFNYLPQYRMVAERLAMLYQSTNLRQFGGLNMGTMFTRFERAFASKSEKGKESEENNNKDSTEPAHLSAADFNYVQLPFDATLSEATSLLPAAFAKPNSSSAQKSNHEAKANTQSKIKDQHSRVTSSCLHGNMYNHSCTRHIGLDGGDVFQAAFDVSMRPEDAAAVAQFASAQGQLNAQLGVGSSTRDVFAKMTEDQEPWKLWARGFRNKVLSLSMRPLGGPALGSRNRPGLVSEREWFRYAVRALDTIQTAEYLQGFVRAAMLARES